MKKVLEIATVLIIGALGAAVLTHVILNGVTF